MKRAKLARRLVIAWGLVAAGFVVAIGPASPWVLGAVVTLFAAVVLASARTAALLARARSGELALDGARPWRFWAIALAPLVVGVVFAQLLTGLSWTPLAPRVQAIIGFALALAFAIPVGLRWGQREAKLAPRSTSWTAWVLLDTALPFALVAALASWLIVDWRFGPGAQLSPVESARHLAGTTLVQGLLGGLAGLLKVGRERLAGLVRAPEAPSLPGPTALSLILFIAVLLVGPRVLPELSADTLALPKTLYSFVLVFVCAGLGAARAAGPLSERAQRATRRPEVKHGDDP